MRKSRKRRRRLSGAAVIGGQAVMSGVPLSAGSMDSARSLLHLL